MNGYVETFKDKCGDMNSNNKLMSLRISCWKNIKPIGLRLKT